MRQCPQVRQRVSHGRQPLQLGSLCAEWHLAQDEEIPPPACAAAQAVVVLEDMSAPVREPGLLLEQHVKLMHQPLADCVSLAH